MDNTTVQFLIKLKDEFSGTLKTISGHTEKMNQQMEHGEGLVKKLGAALAGFFAIEKGFEFGSSAVEAYNKHAQAAIQLETSLKSTHGAIGLSMDQLNEQAESLSGKSLFEKTNITHMQGILATFTQVKGVIAEQAQPAILDLAAKMGGDLQGAAVQLGKALNDPIKGVTALRRVGVSFTQSQMDMIKSLVQTGHAVEAQKLILKELQTEFGGSAEAATKVGTGPLTMMKKKFEEVKIEIGELIMRGIGKLLPYIEEFVEYIKTTGIPYIKSWAGEIKAIGKEFLSAANYIKENWSAIKSLLEIMAVAIFSYKAIIGLVKLQAWYTGLSTGAIVANTLATEGLTAAMVALDIAMEANPLALMVAGATVAAVAIYNIVDAVKDLINQKQILHDRKVRWQHEAYSDEMNELKRTKDIAGEYRRLAPMLEKFDALYKKTGDNKYLQAYLEAGEKMKAIVSFSKSPTSKPGLKGDGTDYGGENPSFQPESLVKEKLTNITINITEMNGIKTLSVAGMDEGLDELEDKVARMLLGLFEAPERMLGAHI